MGRIKGALLAILSSLLSLGGLALVACISTPWIYFQFFSAKHDHWVGFVIGMAFPPAGFIGGLLVWLGFLWHQFEPTSDQMKLMQARTTYFMISSASLRCKWADFSVEDRSLALSFSDQARQKLIGKIPNEDIKFGDQFSKEKADSVDCGDRSARTGMRRLLNATRALLN